MLSKEEELEKMAEGAGADLVPSLSRVKQVISNARITISGKNICSFQRTTAFGEQQRYSRATGIRFGHATIKELLSLQAFALAILIYVYFICFPLKFGIFCLT